MHPAVVAWWLAAFPPTQLPPTSRTRPDRIPRTARERERAPANPPPLALSLSRKPLRSKSGHSPCTLPGFRNTMMLVRGAVWQGRPRVTGG